MFNFTFISIVYRVLPKILGKAKEGIIYFHIIMFLNTSFGGYLTVIFIVHFKEEEFHKVRFFFKFTID